jgi:UDP-glucose 4-epimerase
VTQPESNLLALRGRRVLITGGLGFIGSNLAHRCVALGAEVTIYDCLDPHSGGNRGNLEGIEGNVRLILDDIRNPEGVRAAVAGQDIVFNCAAYTSHPNSMREPFTDIEVNCMGTLNVLEALRHVNPGARLVHVGTSTQIGRLTQARADEGHPEFPLDIYSANKSAAEKYAMIYGGAYGLRVTVIRLANTFGPRSKISSPDFGFVNYFVGLALQGRDLPIYGDGSQLRTLCYVDDAVDSLLGASLSDRCLGKVFFSASDHQHSVLEITREIVAIVGGRVSFVDWPPDRRAIEAGDAIISSAALHAALGWSPRRGLREGLEQTRAYFTPRLKAYL